MNWVIQELFVPASGPPRWLTVSAPYRTEIEAHKALVSLDLRGGPDRRLRKLAA